MFLVMKSQNAKIGNIAATYLPIEQTCPESCKLKNNGCYAKTSFAGIHNKRLENAHSGMYAYDIVRKEAREIIKNAHKSKGQALRLHVSGDARTNGSAKLLANAAKHWNGMVYSYTHAWRDVSRKSWGKISILASCETIDDVKRAHKKGYAASLIVESHKDSKAYDIDGVKVIPCPSQTKDVTCEQCRLCMRDEVLHKQKAVIAFAAHGSGKKRMLTVLK